MTEENSSPDNIEQQPENPAADSNVDGANSPDELDQELADLVEETGPISKEAELLADLQRLQAEFVNYKSRVERDRDQSRNCLLYTSPSPRDTR